MRLPISVKIAPRGQVYGAASARSARKEKVRHNITRSLMVDPDHHAEAVNKTLSSIGLNDLVIEHRSGLSKDVSMHSSLARGASHLHSKQDMGREDGRHEELTNHTLSNIRCIRYTGASCMMHGCSAFHGPSFCSEGRCLCTFDACASVDGECYKKQNRPMSSRFTLRNVRWPNYYMTVATTGAYVEVSNLLPPDPGSYFSLYEFPYSAAFLVGSAVHPHIVVTERRELFTNPVQTVTFSKIETEGIPLAQYLAPRTLALRFVATPRPVPNLPTNTTAFMIGSVEYPSAYIGMSALTWNANSYIGDVGAASYWIADPPFNISLEQYNGPLCNFNCGSYGSGSGLALPDIGLVVVLFLILCFFLVCLCSLTFQRYGIADNIFNAHL